MDQEMPPALEPVPTPAPTPEEPSKSNTNTWLIVGIVLVVLCCCCVVAAGFLGWTFGDQVIAAIKSILGQ